MALLTVCGCVYLLLALWGGRDFYRYWVRVRQGQVEAKGRGEVGYAPDVTILKPVKGVDARMYAGLASHCRQEYAGAFEMVFGVSSLDDPAVVEIERLRVEFPAVAIRVVGFAKPGGSRPRGLGQ